MSFTYDPSTDQGKVRWLAADTVDAGHVFEDAEIQSALDINEGSIFYAAADLCDSRALIIAGAGGGSITVLDITIDSSKAAGIFSARAKALRARADDDGYFAIVEMVNEPFGAWERFVKEFERSAI